MSKNNATLRPPSPTLHMVILTLVGLFLFVVIGSFVTKTGIIARGRSSIISNSRLQVVQPKNAGQVA
ncbi:hypothetical protein [Bartonella sp. DGB2]|uniref:hypothetical protein n=1 Tax=Bartonella sp. DGB2 TaxID=3388426 RepID=UPI0039900BCC